MKKLLLTSCLCVVLFVSCSSNKEYPVKITEENGIKTISNPNYPKEGIYDLVLEEKFTLGKEDSNPKYFFGMPAFLELDKNNNLYVFDISYPKIFVFDKTGKYLRSFGRTGNGPGDFGKVSFIKSTNDGKIILHDFHNTRVCLFDTLGNYLDGVLYKSFHSWLQLDSKNNIFITHTNRSIDGLSTQSRLVKTTETIRKLDPVSKQFKDINTYPGTMHYMSITADGGTMGITTSDGFWWAISPSDKIITGVADLYEFTFSSLDGKLLYKLTRKHSPFVNKDYKEGSKQNRYRPAFTRHTVVDDKENLWVNLDNGDKPEIYIYDIYSPEGIYQKQVHSKYAPYLFKGGLIYSIIYTDKEIPYVKAFKFSIQKKDK